MGMPMARHLCAAGYAVTVYNRGVARREQAREFGAQIAASPREAAAEADVLITMLTDPAAVRAVMEGADGFLARAKKGLIWIQMSTLDIASTREFARIAEAQGLIFVDCPVTGSKKQVEGAELILLSGTTPETLERLRPLLLCLGKTIIDTGSVGGGTALKLCLNLVVAQMTTALAEAVSLAQATGLDPALVFQALRAAPALRCAYYDMKGEALLQQAFAPAFSLANLAKDVGFMVREAQARNLELPVTTAVQQLLQKAKDQGHGEKDVTAVYLALQQPGEK
jgi:3-hydroxyisobutyrate dehydrogenase-like beta-hydroxyacid dehydrogenase